MPYQNQWESDTYIRNDFLYDLTSNIYTYNNLSYEQYLIRHITFNWEIDTSFC